MRDTESKQKRFYFVKNMKNAMTTRLNRVRQLHNINFLRRFILLFVDRLGNAQIDRF